VHGALVMRTSVCRLLEELWRITHLVEITESWLSRCSAVHHSTLSSVAFLARESMQSALYAIARPSVCTSVRLSVCHTDGSIKNGW